MRSFARPFLVLILFAALLAPASSAKTQGTDTASGPARLSPAQAPDVVQYYNGATQYSTIFNCVSIIQGMPYYEYGIGTYVGFAADPTAALPGPGMVYYVHVVVGGLGNACSGQRAYIDLQLPASTSLAISVSNPVLCYVNGVPLSPSSDCPQVLPASSLNPGAYIIPSPDITHAQTWPLPQGSILEIQVPVVSSTALTSSILQANVWALDGNSSPWLRPQVGVYIFSNTPSLFYPTPSTDAITATSVTSHATLYSRGQSGTVYFDLGTTQSYGLYTVSGAIAAGPTAWLLDSSWPGFTFTPNTVYHWRARFVSDNGPTYYGADQTFQTLPDGQVSVGSGFPGGCTEAAFNSALSTPGVKKIVFDCGLGNVTIALTGSKSIASSLTIDGDNKVTLQGNNTFRLLDVAAPATLTLNKITLTGGNVIGCGGALHVQGGASLVATTTRLTNNNASGDGGALCVDANGGAELTSVYITANHAGGNGGGIYNAGLVDLMWSEVSGNSASGTGSGGGAYNSGNIYFITSLLASNQTATFGMGLTRGQQAGGGLYNSGNAGIFASSVANNLASYGGGIFNNGGTLSITSVTIADNASNAYGKNAELQSGGLDSSLSGNAYVRNTLIARNTAAGVAGNCGTSPQKTIISQGNNLDSESQCSFDQPSDKVNTDPRLGTLGNNGGPTRTLALIKGSPAIDAADNVYCGMYDQRGYSGPTGGQTLARAVDGNGDGNAVCDIGAFEYFPTVFIPFVRR